MEKIEQLTPGNQPQGPVCNHADPIQHVQFWSICRHSTGNAVVLNFTTQSGQAISLELPAQDFNEIVAALQDYEIEAFSLGMGTH